jgi:hypothetical protein
MSFAPTVTTTRSCSGRSAVPAATSALSLPSSWRLLRTHLDGLYINFESDQRPERLADAYPGETLTRLRKVKATYDPDNAFKQNFAITPGVRHSSSTVPISALASPAVGVRDDEPASEDVRGK